MKDLAVAIASRHEDPMMRLNVLREYVQAFVLRSLHESEAANSIAFVGGTALRFLEDLPRYSEDLDYSLLSREHYRPLRWFDKIKRDLTAAGFEATVTWNDRRTVQTGWIRIASILKEVGLTEHGDQNLSVKVEIDTNPPDGGVVRRSISMQGIEVS